MRYALFLISFLLLNSEVNSQSKKKEYLYTIDLTNVVDDKVYVELTAPRVSQEEVIFYFPKMIPGTYAIEDYGRFISDLKAFDKKGKELGVEKTGTNSWKIKTASKLSKISYWVDDTFDTDRGEPSIFQPAGINFEDKKNFILNTCGVFGYFDGAKDLPFTFKVIRDKEMYGSTGLIAQRTGDPLSKLNIEKPEDANKRVDVYSTESYDRLVDSPVMYAKTDTAIIKVANAEVLIGSYSPNGKITAKEIANSLRELLMAQNQYLGGKLPVDKYAFVFYWTDQPVRSTGALEHSYSSVYFLREAPIDQVKQTIRDVASHEFFHIVTPLNIHSEEIGQFDFNDPKMSKHLWMYEGVTEYFASNMQVKYGLITPEKYLATLRQKMIIADNFLDDVPFTEISKLALEKHANQYYNVYQKGALIGLCMDVKLRQLSKGTYGMQNLMTDLSKKYGKNQAFKDDELFAQITSLTYPEIGEFLNRYVNGPERLPYKEVFESLGVTYVPEKSSIEFSVGIESRAIRVLTHEEKPKISIANPDMLNEQGKALNFVQGDILTKINGEAIPDLGPASQAFLEKQKQSLKEGGTLSVTVLRKNEKDEYKETELSAPVQKVDRKLKHNLEFNSTATPEQISLRESWLSPR
jgi:predicted metalloprotease with PDZ domain